MAHGIYGRGPAPSSGIVVLDEVPGRALNLESMPASPAAVAQIVGTALLPDARPFSAEEAAGYRARLEAVERERGGSLGGELATRAISSSPGSTR